MKRIIKFDEQKQYLIILIRSNLRLDLFEYDLASFLVNSKNTYNQDKRKSSSNDYPWYVASSSNGTKNIILRAPKEIIVFQVVEKEIKKVKTLNIHQGYTGHTIFFEGPSSTRNLGILVGNTSQLHLYNLNLDSLELQNMEKSVGYQSGDKIMQVKKSSGEQSVISISNSQGVVYHDFDKNALMDAAMTSVLPTVLNDNEQFHFIKLSNAEFQDVVHLRGQGLSLYKYQEDTRRYALVYKNDQIIDANGWTKKAFIHFQDVDGDGKEEIIFRTRNNIVCLKYEHNYNQWKEILDMVPNHINIPLAHYSALNLILVTKHESIPVFVVEDTMNMFKSFRFKIPISSFQTSNRIYQNEYIEVQRDEDSLQEETSPPDAFKSRYPDVNPMKSIAQPSTPIILPSKARMSKDKKKMHLRWNEFNKLENLEGRGDGKFKVPLIDFKLNHNLQFSYFLVQDPDLFLSTRFDYISRNWAINLNNNYIYTLDMDSTLEINHLYYLVVEGKSYLLKEIESNDIGKRNFKNDHANMKKIQYDKATQQWTLEDDLYVSVFGNANNQDAVAYGLAIPDWRGEVSIEVPIEKYVSVPTYWYPNSKLDKETKKTIFCKYEKEVGGFARRSRTYTKSIRLTSITDNDKFTLNFNYESKNLKNDGIQILYGAKLKPKLQVPMSFTHRLIGYELNSEYYKQKIRLEYVDVDLNVGSKKMLHKIVQDIDGTDEAIAEFIYTKMEKYLALTHTKIGGDITVTLNYQTRLTNRIPIVGETYDATTKALLPFSDATDQFKITFGHNFVVSSDIYNNGDQSEIRINILNKDLNKNIDNQLYEYIARLPKGVQERHENLAIMMNGDSFLHFFKSGSQYYLNFHTYLDGRWSVNKRIFSINTIIKLNNHIIVLKNNGVGKLTIIEFSENKWLQDKEFDSTENVKYLSLHRKTVVCYDHRNIRIIAKTNNGWNVVREIPQSLSNDNLFNNFNIDDGTKGRYEEIYEGSRIDINNNYVALSHMYVSIGYVDTNLYLYRLDSSFGTADYNRIVLNSETISNMQYEYTSAGSVYKLKYKGNGPYLLEIKQIIGQTEKDFEKSIRNKSRRRKAVAEFMEKINRDESEKGKFLATFFLPKLYPLKHTGSGIIYDDENILKFTGQEWVKEPIENPKTIKLGSDFILDIETDNLYFLLVGQGESNRNETKLDFTSSKKFVNNYPHYLAYTEGSDTKVVTFNDDLTTQTKIIKNEQLSTLSNIMFLLTTKPLKNDPTRSKIYVRSTQSLIPQKPNLLLTNVKYVGTSKQIREIVYERTPRTTLEKFGYKDTLKTTFCSDKTKCGYLEETFNINLINHEDSTKSIKVFGGDGNKIDTPTKSGEKEALEIDKATQLYDDTGLLTITQSAPFKVSDDMIGYYGFQNYESKQQSITLQEGKWCNSNGQIINNQFPYTGDNHLALDSTTTPSYINRIFTPKYQDMIFIASCWIRSTSLVLGQTTELFKTSVTLLDGTKILGFKGEVKKQNGDWFYVEIANNLPQIYDFYASYLDKIGSVVPENILFKIDLKIEASANEKVDVDHIVFHPLNYEFKATVFNTINSAPSSIIETNGKIANVLYNEMVDEIANLADNQIEYLISISNTGKLIPNPIGSIQNNRKSKFKFQPESSHYHIFDDNSIKSKWSIQNPQYFERTKSQLVYSSTEHISEMKVISGVFDPSSNLIRFVYSLDTENSYLSLNWADYSIDMTTLTSSKCKILIGSGQNILNLPASGELIVYLENKHLFILVNGVLVFDEIKPFSLNPWSSFSLKFRGDVMIEHLMTLKNTQVEVTYFNEFGSKSQEVKLESDNAVIITQFIDDEFGNLSVSTKPTRVTRSSNDASILAYDTEFVTNLDPDQTQTYFWKTNTLQGKVHNLNSQDNGYCYIQTEYHSNPLQKKKRVGLPGKDFSVKGRYSKKMAYVSSIPQLRLTYSKDQGYSIKEEKLANGNIKSWVYDKRNNRVAEFVQVVGYDDLLTTFEYDSHNRLTKIIPPSFHKQNNTLGHEPQKGINNVLQNQLGAHFSYNSDGNLIQRYSSDTGNVDMIYDSNGNIKFMISEMKSLFFNYDASNQLISSGHLESRLTKTEILALAQHEIPTSKEYQRIDYGDDSLDLDSRGKFKRIITNYDTDSVIEEIEFNEDELITSKSAMIENKQASIPYHTIKKSYSGDKIKQLTYPIKFKGKPLELIHTYDKLGNLLSLGTVDQPNLFASFEYNASGQIIKERISNSYDREYEYNSPRFLVKIMDKFLEQSIDYTGTGYGNEGHGDGIVMRTTFDPKWVNEAPPDWFRIKKHEDIDYEDCYEHLINEGLLSEDNKPLGFFTKDVLDNPNLLCDAISDRVLLAMSQNLVKTKYGHVYGYNNHDELIHSKYFVEDIKYKVLPLKMDTFHKELPTQFTSLESSQIWAKLIQLGMLNSLLKDKERKIIVGLVKQDADLNSLQFSSTLQAKINHIKELLQNRMKFNNDINPFDLHITGTDAHGNHKSFNTKDQPFNFTYDQDKPNQIVRINARDNDMEHKSKNYAVTHDGDGNLTKNEYRKIQSIEYHPFSSRTSKITLTDGTTLGFYYDAQGERIYKQVRSAQGRLLKEKYNLKVENTNVLMDKQITHEIDGTKVELVTSYIYGSNGLIGFIRNEQFYSVFKDHTGSIRLVIHNDKVVASYDYYPYGELMRSFGTDSMAKIDYLFSGKEFDIETGLYNFHARLYDPLLGRFYQVDPKQQNHSPYIYASNSPLSLIDPDGQLAFLIILGLLLIIPGMYLGAAAVNQSWNPAEWDWSDPMTYVGALIGGITGFFLPMAFAASVTFFGGLSLLAPIAGTIGANVLGVLTTIAIGSALAYVSAAVANGNEWNVARWDLGPETFNALFQGFATGVGLFAGVGVVRGFAVKLVNTGHKVASRAISPLTYVFGATGAYIYASKASGWKFNPLDWHYKSPEFWESLINGLDMGLNILTFFLEAKNGLRKMRAPKEATAALSKGLMSKFKLSQLKGILNNKYSIFFKAIAGGLMGYLMTSAISGDFSIKLEQFSYATVEAFFNGACFGKSLMGMYISAKKPSIPKLLDGTILAPLLGGTFKGAFNKIRDGVMDLYKQRKHSKMMEESFSSQDSIMSLFQKSSLKNSNQIRQQLTAFFSAGVQNFRKGISKIPKFLFNLVRRLVQNQIRKLGQEILPAIRATLQHNRAYNIDPINSLAALLGVSKYLTLDTPSRPAPQSLRSDVSDFLLATQRALQIPSRNGFQSLNRIETSVGIDPVIPLSRSNFAESVASSLDEMPDNLLRDRPNGVLDIILGSLSTLPSRIGKQVEQISVKIENYRTEVPYTRVVEGHDFDTDLPYSRLDDHNKVLKIFTEARDKALSIVRRYIITRSGDPDAQPLIDRNSDFDDGDINHMRNGDADAPVKQEDNNINADKFKGVKSKDLPNSFHKEDRSPIEPFEPIYLDGLDNLDLLESYLSKFNLPKQALESEASEFVKEMIQIYTSLDVKNRNSKSLDSFYKFIYGSLSLNYQKSYRLQLYSQYLDSESTLLIIGDDWNATPILVGFNTTPANRFNLLYNLGIKTLKEEVIYITPSLNPSTTNRFTPRVVKIPKHSGFINSIFSTSGIQLERLILEELKHLYYSIPHLTPCYLSHFLLGQFMTFTNLESYIKVTQQKQSKIFNFIFKTSINDWYMINLVQDSVVQSCRDQCNPSQTVCPEQCDSIPINIIHSNIGLPSLVPSKTQVIVVDLFINTYSKSKWQGNLGDFYQNLKVSTKSNLISKNGFNRIPTVTNTNLFTDNEHQNRNGFSTFMKTYLPHIKSNLHVLALYHGMFLNSNNQNLVNKVVPKLMKDPTRTYLEIYQYNLAEGDRSKANKTMIFKPSYLPDNSNILNYQRSVEQFLVEFKDDENETQVIYTILGQLDSTTSNGDPRLIYHVLPESSYSHQEGTGKLSRRSLGNKNYHVHGKDDFGNRDGLAYSSATKMHSFWPIMVIKRITFSITDRSIGTSGALTRLDNQEGFQERVFSKTGKEDYSKVEVQYCDFQSGFLLFDFVLRVLRRAKPQGYYRLQFSQTVDDFVDRNGNGDFAPSIPTNGGNSLSFSQFKSIS